MLPPDFKLARSGVPVEPLTLPDAKNFLKISAFTNDDALILDLITAARRKCEQIGNKGLVPSSWTLTCDYLPWRSSLGYWNYWQTACGDPFRAGVIELPQPPLVAVQSIAYVAQDGSVQTINPSTYRVSPGTPGQIEPTYGTIWPFILPEIAAVQINFTAGMDPDDVATVRSAMRLVVGLMYENRSEDVPIPRAVEYILDPVRSYAYA